MAAEDSDPKRDEHPAKEILEEVGAERPRKPPPRGPGDATSEGIARGRRPEDDRARPNEFEHT